MFTPQEKNKTEFIKMTRPKVHIALNLVTVCHFLDDPRLFVIVL